MDKPIISIKEARKILGKSVQGMSDDELIEVISTLDLMAKDALVTAQRRITMKQDARALANLIYDVYKDERHKTQ